MAVQTGTILIDQSAVMPGSLRLESEPDSKGWISVRHSDRHALAKDIDKAGWTFFFMAGELHTGAFGVNQPKAVRAP